jgi:DUF971 family protein
MNLYPVQLQIVAPASLLIQWSDGRKQQYPLAELRARCPCASCREERKSDQAQPAELLPILPTTATPPLGLVSMKPVGNYAYSLTFSDGHDTGIYTFEYLRELGHEVLRDEQEAAGSHE